MNVKRLVAIAVVSTLMVGGVAALGAAAPADQDGDTAADTHGEHAPEDVSVDAGPDDVDAGAADRDDDAGNADGVGPADGLPDQAPDHVSEIHDRIDSFLSGSADNLGESLGELLGDDAAEGTTVENSD